MAGFKWNWQQKDWPDFYYDKEALKYLENINYKSH
jgi:hypothetical protein